LLKGFVYYTKGTVGYCVSGLCELFFISNGNLKFKKLDVFLPPWPGVACSVESITNRL
jgi:hypothetical protein